MSEIVSSEHSDERHFKILDTATDAMSWCVKVGILVFVHAQTERCWATRVPICSAKRSTS